MGTTMATKFVAWEVPTLDALKGTRFTSFVKN